MTLHSRDENSALAFECNVCVPEINSEMFVSAEKHHQLPPEGEE